MTGGTLECSGHLLSEKQGGWLATPLHPPNLNIVIIIIIITIITLILYSVETTLFYVLLSYIKVLSMAHPH